MEDTEIILTDQQETAVKYALEGHNLCILGKAGTGKSAVVRRIKSNFTRQSIKCQIVCSSGIACDVYDIGEVATVHSHYGLQKAEIPFRRLLQRVLCRNDVISRIKETRVLIWDEISMSSQRILEIINRLLFELFGQREPFGGIQVILVGDFLQLKPVPSILDPGNFMFKSVVFDIAFPHRIELTVVLRQDLKQTHLKDALDELRSGKCSDMAERFFQSLNRDFPNVQEAVHIYFKRLLVEVHKFNVLMILPGDLLKFESTCTGNASSLENTIPRIVHLKEGCKVMLLYNLNRSLRNGSRGTFLGMANDHEMKVFFPNTGVVQIARKTWYAHDKEGKQIGNRTQFPIAPCYAMTAHKAQGLTLDSVVVHCSPEFVPGQTYVTISRIRTVESLKVIGFKKTFILPLPRDIVNFKVNLMSESSIPGSCCVHRPVLDVDTFFDVQEEFCESAVDEGEQDESLQVEGLEQDQEKLILSYFEENEGVVLDLEDVFLSVIEFEKELCKPPSSFDAESFIKTFVNATFDDDFTKSINEASRYAIEHIEEFKLVIGLFWAKLFELFKDHLVDNPDRIYINNKDFTCAIGKVNSVFLTNEYRSYVITVFRHQKWSDVNVGQQALCAQMFLRLYQLLVAEIAQKIDETEQLNPINFSVEKMNDYGKGKVRHVGGWAIRKVIECSRRYVRENKFSQSNGVRARLMREARKVDLLENHVVTPFEHLESSSSTPGTLAVIEARQYRERGLLHVIDKSFDFFIKLEQRRVNEINEGKLKQLTDNMVEKALCRVREDEELRAQFLRIFEFMDDEIDTELLGEIYRDIVTRYFRMGAGQFLRDFRRSAKVKKAAAHRKQVLQRKEKAATKGMKVHLPQIELDKSPNKQTSHGRLVALLEHSKEKGFLKVYTKAELQKLCEGYNVDFRVSWGKQKLTELLTAAIRSNANIPAHQLLSNFTSVVVQPCADQHTSLRMRIRRS